MIKSEEYELQAMYHAVEKATMGGDPLVVAGIFMAQAIKIYKTILCEEEFNQVTEYILKTKGNIDEIEKPTLQ